MQGSRREEEADDKQPLIVELPSPDATQNFGRRLGELLFPGSVVALIGPLGAGKTHLARAIAEGLQIKDSRIVTSPTFVLIQEYDARLPIYHFDTYRLADECAFLDLGVQEYFAGEGVCLIEWADRVERFLPAEYLRVTLEVTGETTRKLTVQGLGPRDEKVLQGLRPAQ
jgi:tRNA threonylcarbamoyladenosine biosynthesis protein TsaE